MNSIYLVHHGILGQRWGIRRFQNKDGSYTAAGRARYGVDSDEQSSSKGSISSNSSPVHNDYMRAHYRKSVEEMSDQELREVLNRLNMERQINAINQSEIKDGKYYYNKTLAAVKGMNDAMETATRFYTNVTKITDAFGITNTKSSGKSNDSDAKLAEKISNSKVVENLSNIASSIVGKSTKSDSSSSSSSSSTSYPKVSMGRQMSTMKFPKNNKKKK